MKIIHIMDGGTAGQGMTGTAALAEQLGEGYEIVPVRMKAGGVPEAVLHGAQLLYCHGAVAARCGSRIAKQRGIPFVFECAGEDVMAYGRRECALLHAADCCAADGAQLDACMLNGLGVDPARVRAVSETSEQLAELYRHTVHMAQRSADRRRDGAVICGAYGRGNAGDDAILNAIIHELHQADAEMPVYVTSRRPEETRCRNGVQACHTFDFPALWKALGQAVLFISGGGSLIQNATSRRSLYYYLLLLCMAKLRGCRVMMYGCGIGPVYGGLHRWAAARVIDKCVDIITLRDDDSVQELANMGVSHPHIVRTADPTICIQQLESGQTEQLFAWLGIPADGRYIGFGLREWKGFDRAAPEIARAAQYAWETYGLVPVFVPIEYPHDCDAAEKVIRQLHCPYFLISEQIAINETISVLSRMSLVVGMRLHSLIFAVENGVPSIGISYDMKVDGFLKSIGRQDVTLHVQDVTGEQLMEQIDRLQGEQERSRWKQAAGQLTAEESGNLEQMRALLASIAQQSPDAAPDKQGGYLSKRGSSSVKTNKIYLTSLHLKHGGVEMVISTLANALVEQGFEVEILCTYRLGEPVYPLNDNVVVTYLTKDAPNRRQFSDALHQKNPIRILQEGVRAVKILYRKHSTMKRAIQAISDGTVIATRNEHAILLSKYGASQVKKIVQLHADHQFDKKLIHDFQTKYQNIDYFVLLTDQTTREIREFMQGHNSRIQCLTIPNFIEPPDIPPVSHREKQVIAAGRLHADKDFPSLLRIWAKVVPTHPDWMLKIAGEGELEQMLKQYAAQLKIENNVCFTGALEHRVLLTEMAKSACFALTSVSESFGLVLVESMSCGTPPVAFDIRVGPATIIEDNVSGFLVPNRDEDLFAQKLIQLIDDAELRAAMSGRATERAAVFYKDHVLQQWLKLLGA